MDVDGGLTRVGLFAKPLDDRIVCLANVVEVDVLIATRWIEGLQVRAAFLPSFVREAVVDPRVR